MASTITITCPECDKLLKVPSQAEGKKVRCSACDATFVARSEDDDDSGPGRGKAAKAEKVKPAAKPAAKAKQPDDPFTADTTAFGMREEYLGRRCPECANAIGDDDRICLTCGYDTVTRSRARTRKVQHITGFDITLWLLPGIFCTLLVLGILGGLTYMWIKVDRAMFGEVWYDFLGSLGMKVYASAMGLFIVYKAGRFAIRRLILHPKPPEVELKLETGRHK
jgi:LSD1 subclass zinc finger protein